MEQTFEVEYEVLTGALASMVGCAKCISYS